MAKRVQCKKCKAIRSLRYSRDGLCRKCWNNKDKRCFVCAGEYYKYLHGHDLCQKHWKMLRWLPKQDVRPAINALKK